MRHDALVRPAPVPAAGVDAVPEQDPATQHSPRAQTVPHAPQLSGSVRSSVQIPAQTEPAQVPQEPFTHDSLGAHVFPHAPQLNGSKFMSGQ